jgi:hypothetical protein
VAKEFKKSYNLPWIADLRDLWSQNHDYHFNPLRRMLDRQLEVNTLSSADSLVTVTKPWAERLGQIHGNKRIYAIPNGFDPNCLNPGRPLTSDFSITYTGFIYKGKQDPNMLLQALDDLIRNKEIDPNDVQVDFCGYVADWLAEKIEEHHLGEVVNMRRSLSREDVIEKQRESQLLLSLSWNDAQEIGHCPGKLFEYLAAMRPILSIGKAEGVAKTLLERTGTGHHFNNVASLKDELRRCYHQFKKTGAVEYTGSLDEIKKYSHVEMARKYSELLDSLTIGGSASRKPELEKTAG